MQRNNCEIKSALVVGEITQDTFDLTDRQSVSCYKVYNQKTSVHVSHFFHTVQQKVFDLNLR